MAVEVVYTIQDKSGDQATTSVKLATGVPIALIQGFAVGFATALNNIIYGKILSAAAYILASVSGLANNTIAAISDVEHIAKFEFLTQGGNRVKVNVPALGENGVQAWGSDELNQAETNVAAFIAAMETGIAVTGGTISPCDIGESSIVDTVFAREAFKNSGARR